MMTEQQNEHPVSTVESLPADSSWWTFFKTDYFGKNYCNFKGRASRREWWATSILCLLVLLFCGRMGYDYFILRKYLWVMILYFILPLLAVAARRYHDFGLSGWWGGTSLCGVMLVLYIAQYISQYILDPSGIMNCACGKVISPLNLFYILYGQFVTLWLSWSFLAAIIKGQNGDNKYGKNIYNETKEQ